MTTRKLSPWQIEQLADNLSRFGAESVNRQIALHVANGDATDADAVVLLAATNNRRNAVHASALQAAFAAGFTPAEAAHALAVLA